MNKYFALIKNGIVETIAFGDDIFLEHIKDKYDIIVDVTEKNRPQVGDSYYNDTNSFISNFSEVINIPVDLNQDHLKHGTNSGFEPFTISKYSVKYENGMIQIGCKKYSAAGCMDSLHKILIEKNPTNQYFTIRNGEPHHGKFNVTLEDAKKIYNALLTVKFQ